MAGERTILRFYTDAEGRLLAQNDLPTDAATIITLMGLLTKEQVYLANMLNESDPEDGELDDMHKLLD